MLKSQLVPRGNGLGLSRTGHARTAVNNLRKKRCLPEAIERLVKEGLSSEAATGLVTKVLHIFGLTTKEGRENPIVKQSAALYELRHTPAAEAETKLLPTTERTVMSSRRLTMKK